MYAQPYIKNKNKRRNKKREIISEIIDTYIAIYLVCTIHCFWSLTCKESMYLLSHYLIINQHPACYTIVQIFAWLITMQLSD